MKKTLLLLVISAPILSMERKETQITNKPNWIVPVVNAGANFIVTSRIADHGPSYSPVGMAVRVGVTYAAYQWIAHNRNEQNK